MTAPRGQVPPPRHAKICRGNPANPISQYLPYLVTLTIELSSVHIPDTLPLCPPPEPAGQVAGPVAHAGAGHVPPHPFIATN